MMSKDFAFGQAMAAAAYGYHPALYGTHLASPFGLVYAECVTDLG